MSEFLKSLQDGFRNPKTIEAISNEIKTLSRNLNQTLRIMEVCGGHTHTIMKYGLTQLLPEQIEFVHGPGCPVCVIPKERIDQAIALAKMENSILVTLGDMIRVPGSNGSLAEARSSGYDVKAIYSPLDLLNIARENPDKKVIFFAVGFETTTPMSASIVLQAQKENLNNFYIHVNHVMVPPPMEMIMEGEQTDIHAFIAPSHVSVITGTQIYEPIAERYQVPIVISGFEPVDILEGIRMILNQHLKSQYKVEIQYSRVVKEAGNIRAKDMIERVFEKRESFRWRGLGNIERSGLTLRDEYASMDAEKVFAPYLVQNELYDHPSCICGSILKGAAKPFECAVFAKECTPASPMGSCMVSSEGSCNAYYRYGEWK